MFDADNLLAEPIEAEELPPPDPPLLVARPHESARFKADNFSYQTLLAGDSLVVELYGISAGGALPAHRHETTEHVLTVASGEATVRIGERTLTLRQGESALAPARLYHGIDNKTNEPLMVQQVSSPKPWDARFFGPYPSQLGRTNVTL